MVLKIGHRGARGYEPENTILSFQKALELGMDYVELDVRLSKDNKVIVIHDETIDRTTNGTGKVSGLTLEEIKKYRTLEKNQEIPTLEETIKKLKGRIKLSIEVKENKAMKKVLELIKKMKAEENVLISSNELGSLRLVKEENSKIKTALEYHAAKTKLREYIFVLCALLVFPITKKRILKKLRDSLADGVYLVYPLATRSFVEKLKNKGFKVVVWTVNKPKIIKRMIERKVDGIITDYPDRLNF